MRKILHRISNRIVNLFRKVSILSRLICVMLCLSIIPTLFITYFAYSHYVVEIGQNTQQYLSLLVKNVSTQIQERQETYEYILRSFYSDSYIMSLVEENEKLFSDSSPKAKAQYATNVKLIQEHLCKLSTTNRYILNFELITDTQQYNSTNSKGYNTGAVVQDIDDFRKSDFYTKAIDNEGYPVWFDTTSSTNLVYKVGSLNGIGNTFTVTTAVYPPGKKDTPIGVLMMNIDLSFLTHSLTNYTFYGTGNTLLITDRVLTALNPNVNAPILSYNDYLQEIFNNEQSGEVTQNVDGRNLFISFQKNSNPDLYVAHIVDMDVLLAQAYKIRQLCIVVLIVLILVSFLVAYLTTSSISIPLKELLDNIKAFEHNWDAKRCNVSGHDELTKISNHFNIMADSARTMSDEISKEHLRHQALELSRTKAELNALQMQINPHFLYNTLDLIRWETIRIGNGENDASRMIDRFALLLRGSIKKGEDMVRISSELEQVKAYLDVVNFGRTAKIEFVSSLDFDPEKYKIPKLSLQPLIENSVKHGLQKGVIYPTIRLWGRITQNNTIVITITDNGKGMDTETLELLRKSISDNNLQSESIGLRNVNQRFLLCYGEGYGLSIDSVADMGTDISLRLPAELY